MHSHLWQSPVVDLGFHEGGSYGRARLCGHENVCKPRPLLAKNHALYVVEQYPGVELGVCLRFILAACSLEVVYTGKIAITVDTKNKGMAIYSYNNTSSL